MTTPVLQWNDAGLEAPRELDILAGRLADFNDAFGGNLNITNLETPQGQIASADTVIIGEYNDTILQLVNQVDPRFASGFMQDAIGQIYFLERKASTPTVVSVQCNGAADTTIPVGALVKDDNNNIYSCTISGQISPLGNVTLPFANVTNGAIPCAAGTVNTIYDRQGAFGWESVTNVADGVLGNDVESRAEFEFRRNNSVFLGSQGSLDSAYAAVFNVDNVTDVFAVQNLTDADETLGSTSYVLHPKEVYICALGGTDDQVADAIYSKITGATLVGNTSVSVTSAITGQANTITFNRPSSYTVKFEANIKDSPLLPANTEDLVKQAIVDTFNGANGTDKARIGSTIYVSQYYYPISILDPQIKLISLFIGHTTVNLTSLEIGIDQYPSLSLSNITVNFI